MNKILQGDSWQLAKQLDDDSLDCIVTSPPYWGLRDYGVIGQAGLEEHPQLWVDKMVELCELLRPKLKKSGVMFWNIGETYYNNSSYSDEGRQGFEDKTGMMSKMKFKSPWLQPKQLLGLPWRFAIAMQDKGWILRNSIIWDKPNHMPSSVKDRFSNGYEYVFMFVKSRKYWFDLDAVREPHKQESVERACRGRQSEKLDAGQYSTSYKEEYKGYDDMQGKLERGELRGVASAGKNCGDVWRITTRPHPFAHFAVFPEELAERCIKSGCPEWVCKKCGKAKERIVNGKQNKEESDYRRDGRGIQGRAENQHGGLSGYKNTEFNTVGWSDCGCNAGWQGGVVLDCFMGSGTVAVVAKRLKRQYLGFELSEKYIGIANNRLKGITDWQTIKDIEDGKQKVLK